MNAPSPSSMRSLARRTVAARSGRWSSTPRVCAARPVTITTHRDGIVVYPSMAAFKRRASKP